MSSIRAAKRSESHFIEEIYSSAFPRAEVKLVTDAAIGILQMDVEAISLIAIDGNKPVGHIAFSPLRAGQELNLSAWILAPLAVMPDHQNTGIGGALIRAGLEGLKARQVDWVGVYGDPAYYSRFGFSSESASWLIPNYELSFPHGWQVLSLKGEDAPLIRVRFNCAQALDRADLW